MTDEKQPEEVSPEELEEQEGESLPEREVMTVLPIGDGFTRPLPPVESLPDTQPPVVD